MTGQSDKTDLSLAPDEAFHPRAERRRLRPSDHKAGCSAHVSCVTSDPFPPIDVHMGRAIGFVSLAFADNEGVPSEYRQGW